MKGKRRKSRPVPRNSEVVALPASTETFQDHSENSGIICIVDVEKFSSILTRKEQIDLVRELWNASQRTDLVKLADPPPHINGTGDGLLIAIPWKPNRMEQALRWARDLIHDAQVGRFGRKLRFGLHYGGYTILGGDPGKLAVGTALNECTRVCGIGDGGHVIVSEEFVRQYADHKGWPAIQGVFEPSIMDEHYKVVTKHGARVPFRIYRVNDVIPSVPKRLKIVQVAAKNIKNTLPKIEASFVDALRASSKLENGKSDDLENLDVRICVFEPDYDRDVLKSDEFRHHKNNLHLRPSEAVYSIISPGSGVCGRAFCSRKPFVLHKIPERTASNKRAYDDLHGALGIIQPSIDRWQRHARALVAFPFAVMDHEDLEAALGVVCIDVMDPLEWLEREDLEIIGSDLMGQYGVLLGALFSLRF